MTAMSKSVVIARRPQAVWRAFTAVETLCAWVPGLRSAKEIARDRNGMPTEVQFEYAESRTYTLVYTYEETDVAKIVTWAPRLGARDAVSGMARFELAEGGGTLMTYELHQGAARSDKERFLGSDDEALEAFARWMAESPDRPSRKMR
jgi:uncharacterized protein YndB with AHSA1/START domain